MHWLQVNALQITELPERKNQISCTKTPCLSFCLFLPTSCQWWVTMDMLLYSCECMPSRGGTIKEPAGQTPEMWSLTSSTPDGERQGEREWELTEEAERKRSENLKRRTPKESTVCYWCNSKQSHAWPQESTCTPLTFVPTFFEIDPLFFFFSSSFILHWHVDSSLFKTQCRCITGLVYLLDLFYNNTLMETTT